MKKQIKAQLNFDKKSLVELNSQEARDVDSGWTSIIPVTIGIIAALLDD